MPTDPRAGERAAFGARCRELVNSDLFQQVLSSLNQEYERAILSSRPQDSEKREWLMLEYHALKRIVGRLQDWKSDGDLAQAEMDRENKT